MNHCKDCRFWDTTPDCTVGICGKQCAVVTHSRVTRIVRLYDERIVSKGMARFVTGPDFGCVHFEAKEQPEA